MHYLCSLLCFEMDASVVLLVVFCMREDGTAYLYGSGYLYAWTFEATEVRWMLLLGCECGVFTSKYF